MKTKTEPIIEPIGFFIEGENIVVTNPCTIPIKFLEETLKESRNDKGVTAYFMLKLPFNLLKKKRTKK